MWIYNSIGEMIDIESHNFFEPKFVCQHDESVVEWNGLEFGLLYQRNRLQFQWHFLVSV